MVKALIGVVMISCFAAVGEASIAHVFEFAKYPGYDGDLEVSGTVSIGAHSSTSQMVMWDLKGLDTACTNNAHDGIKNACAIHVHSGTSCEAADDVGGHYYVAFDGNSNSDPWLAGPIYDADGSGHSAGSYTVNSGTTMQDMVGRVFVVHQLDSGARIACGTIRAPASYSVSHFAPYPGYEGNMAVTGFVTLSAKDAMATTQTLTWHLTGVPDACVEGMTAEKNVCGIHVHSGMSCSAHDHVGGHWWGHSSESTDPWLHVGYVAKEGMTMGTTSVSTGLLLSDMKGHAFNVHDNQATRIACGLVDGQKDGGAAFVPEFQKYDGYAGDLVVTGSVAFRAVSQSIQDMIWNLHGLDTTCSAADSGSGIANACSIHIHTGTTCADAAKAGGHYYNSGLSSDPWQSVVYVADAAGHAAGHAMVNTGLLLEDIVGHAFIVHELTNGGRIACGIIQQAPSVKVTGFHPYPGYTGDLHSGGEVMLFKAGSTTQTLVWNLHGVDTACTSGAADDVKNGCAIHTHAGTTCASGDEVGGHYYGAQLAEDPWLPLTYVADSNGDSVGTYTIDSGLTIQEQAGHAFVIHELGSGARVACSVIEAPKIMPTCQAVKDMYKESGCCGNPNRHFDVEMLNTLDMGM